MDLGIFTMVSTNVGAGSPNPGKINPKTDVSPFLNLTSVLSEFTQ
jgi:hypothetical protein